MFVPSMEDFAKMAQAASTPFSGRGFIPEEDENTCAVDLLFKKPTLPTNKNEVWIDLHVFHIFFLQKEINSNLDITNLEIVNFLI